MTLAADRYGADWANDYDEMTPIPEAQTARTVQVLAELADGGPVLELAAGTGRLAIPLARLGLDVTATDASQQMLDRLVAKDAEGQVRTVHCAMPEIPDEEQYGLIVCAYNSITFLSDQDAQTEVFIQAAAHLRPGGRLVVEAVLFDPATFVEARAITTTEEKIFARFSTYDVFTQVTEGHHLVAKGGAVSLRPYSQRMVTPAEQDLMARLAGLRLDERWSSWACTPVLGAGNVISVYVPAG